MNGRIIILKDGCGYTWEIRYDNFIVQGLCNYKHPEAACKGARGFAIYYGMKVSEDVEQRCL